jgi:integrase/recombinase XerD
MDNEPVRWSAEKQQRLADQLTGFWAEDTWLFTSKQGKTCQMRFPLAVPALRAEVKYALWTKFESGRWKVNGNLSPMCRDIKAVLAWLNQLPLIPGSFMQKPLDHWEMSLRSYLIQTGQYRRRKGKELHANQTYVERWEEDSRLRLLRQIYIIVADAYDGREETEKDIWNLSKLGLAVNPSRSEHLLNFTPIAQPWLRQLAKVFMRYKNARRNCVQSLNERRGNGKPSMQSARWLAEIPMLMIPMHNSCARGFVARRCQWAAVGDSSSLEDALMPIPVSLARIG